jgi:hypothetical protein
MTTNDTVFSVFTEAGATMATDLWRIVRKHLFAVPFPNYGLVGRWIAHMARGRFRHESIAAAAPARAENVVGWITHQPQGQALIFGSVTRGTSVR